MFRCTFLGFFAIAAKRLNIDGSICYSCRKDNITNNRKNCTVMSWKFSIKLFIMGAAMELRSGLRFYFGMVFNIIRFFRLYERVCITGVCYMPVDSLCRILTCLVSQSHSTYV